CVPPCRGDINTPTNCEFVIEHDNFLMMTATRRMGSIETEFDGFGKSPSPSHPGCCRMQELLFGAKTPLQNIDTTSWIFFCEDQKERPQSFILANRWLK